MYIFQDTSKWIESSGGKDGDVGIPEDFKWPVVSMDAEKERRCAITNESDFVVDLICLDEEGKEVLSKVIKPGKTHHPKKYSSRPWVVRHNVTRRCLLVVSPMSKAVEISLSAFSD